MHRDLKASNILLKNGEPKICDFGTAYEFSLKSEAVYAGTEPW